MKRLLRRLVAISFTLVVATSSAQRLAPFVAPTVTNVPPGGAVVHAERAAPLPERATEEQTREAEEAQANLPVASSNAVGLAHLSG